MLKDVSCFEPLLFVLIDLLFAVILDKYHWMLYLLAPAMQPRFLITLNEDLEPLPVSVRVGNVSLVPFYALPSLF